DTSTGVGQDEMDEEALAAVIDEGDEGGTAKKVMDAMSRSNALFHDVVWYFFDERPERPPRNTFPKHYLPAEGWMTLLKNQKKREQAFLSGFVARMSARQPLPTQIIEWILDELSGDLREDICLSYFD
ncbi:hypothetical protein LTS18_001494, partial [Coniosporium uncinatum]